MIRYIARRRESGVGQDCRDEGEEGHLITGDGNACNLEYVLSTDLPTIIPVDEKYHHHKIYVVEFCIRKHLVQT